MEHVALCGNVLGTYNGQRSKPFKGNEALLTPYSRPEKGRAWDFISPEIAAARTVLAGGRRQGPEAGYSGREDRDVQEVKVKEAKASWCRGLSLK